MTEAKKIPIEAYKDRCKTCTHWKQETEFWGKCLEPELQWLVLVPDYFGCLWYEPKLLETLKKFQIKLGKKNEN